MSSSGKNQENPDNTLHGTEKSDADGGRPSVIGRQWNHWRNVIPKSSSSNGNARSPKVAMQSCWINVKGVALTESEDADSPERHQCDGLRLADNWKLVSRKANFRTGPCPLCTAEYRCLPMTLISYRGKLQSLTIWLRDIAWPLTASTLSLP